MNFEHYLDNHRPNPGRAALLTFAGALSLAGTTLMLFAGWYAGKLDIARVTAPTVDYVLLSMNMDEPPPPPPPPPPPAGQSEPEPEPEDDPPDEDEPLEEPAPDEVPKKIPSAKTVAGAPRGIPGGQIGGVEGGQLGGIPGGPGIGIPGKPIALRPPSQGSPTMQKALSAVMAQAVYSPDPSSKLLEQTKAARFDKRDGKNVTSFCIDTNGHVVDVRTKSRFPGDPQVDKIIREAIKGWRFKPFVLGSKKVKTCTERTFMLRFK